MSQDPHTLWTHYTVGPPSPPATLSLALQAQLLALCAEVLAKTFILLEQSVTDMAGARTVQHLTRAQDEVKAAQAWQEHVGEG